MFSITTRLQTLIRSTRIHVREHPTRSGLAAIVLIVLVVLVFTAGGGNNSDTSQSEPVPQVTLESVGSLSNDTTSLTLLGEVRSVAQAELRAEKPGQVTRVTVQAGAYVPAGTILAELENASERGAVLQAQGAVRAAEAQLAKTEAGARPEDKASVSAQAEGATITLQSAQASAQTAYSGAYSAAQDAIVAKADTFFSHPYTVDPSFRVRTASYEEKQVLEKERVALGDILNAWRTQTAQPLPSHELDESLANAQANLARIKSFLDSISAFVSELPITSDYTATDKAAQEARMLAARTEVDTARASVNSARQALANAVSAQQVSSLSESKLVTGERPEDIQAAQAAVTQAKGLLVGAVAALERTRVRTPISGIVTTLNVATGDFLSAYQVVAVVANPQALEIEAFASDRVRERIAVGSQVLVDGTYDGTVTSLAPGLDPATKKARLTIGLAKDVPLVNGQSVEIALAATSSTANSANASRNGFYIPLAAIKVLPNGLAVFTVSASSTLEAHPIQEGTIVGDRMLIKDGITSDLMIVTDVRGHGIGDHVDVRNP